MQESQTVSTLGAPLVRPDQTPLMRVDFVGHATLLVRIGNLSILTDPWWSGPAYRGQWYPYPLPVPEQFDLRDLDVVYISHGHEDHLHRETLSDVLRAAPNVMAVIPQRYDTGMRDYLRRIGFRRIREVPGGTHIDLRSGPVSARLRVFTHMDDSMLSIESGGQVLLNANDALHASRRELIDAYCRMLRRRLPRIDYLFCGFGGASYFPNCIHVPGKDDAAVARDREVFFLRNFALVAERLQPRHAFPFAAHFVLPDERNWWISETRLRMEPPADTVSRLAPQLCAQRSTTCSPATGSRAALSTLHPNRGSRLSARAATFSRATAAPPRPDH